MKKTIIIGIVLCLFFLSSVYAAEYEAYLSEFNNPGEICTLADGFYYLNQYQTTTLSSIISCCQESNCIDIPFDTRNFKEYQKEDLREIFEIKHVRKQMSEGKISPNLYSFGDNFNFCNYYGFDSLKDESINLANLFGEKAEVYLPKNAQKIVVGASKTGKALGFISEFNPGVFVTSAVCSGLIDQEKEAIQQVAICNQYTANLRSGNSYYGIVEDLKYCNSQASTKLKAIKDSMFMQLKGMVDIAGNAVTGLFSWAFGDPAHNELKIKKSTYEIVLEAYNKISKEDPNFGNSQSDSKSNAALLRLNEKNTLATTQYNQLENYKNKVIELKHGFFKILITNVFMNPNYNFTDYDNQMSQAKNSLNVMQQDIQISKYNSATSLTQNINSSLNVTELNTIRENQIKRKLDYFAIILTIAIIILAIYGIIKLKENNSFGNY